MQEEKKSITTIEEHSVEVPKKTARLDKKARIVLAVVIVILVFASVITGFVLINSNSEDSNDTKSIATCSGQLLDEAASILYPIDYAKTEQLQALNARIVNLPEYDKDPNCLYPVMQGYVFTGYLSKAVETFKKFESVYGDGSQFASDKYVVNLDSLRQEAEAFEKRIEQIKTGAGNATFGVSAPENESQGSE